MHSADAITRPAATTCLVAVIPPIPTEASAALFPADAAAASRRRPGMAASARWESRVQMAVRRVRVLIEDDPARPERLVTTTSGYALEGPNPLRRVVVGQGSSSKH